MVTRASIRPRRQSSHPPGSTASELEGIVPGAGALILNGAASQAERLKDMIRELVGQSPGWSFFAPSSLAATGQLIEALVRSSIGRIVVAGGDGTVSALTEAVLQLDPFLRPTFGVVPIGTGNDFARTLGIPSDLEEAFEIAILGDPRFVDVVACCDAALSNGSPLTDSCTAGDPRFLINAASAGFAVEATDALLDGDKRRFGPFAYTIAAIEALRSFRAHSVEITVDDRTERLDAVGLVVANGRYLGGGFFAAPLADLEDGLLDVIAFRASSVAELAALVARMKLGAVVEDELLLRFHGRRVVIASDEPLAYHLDGEAWRAETAVFEVRPTEIAFVVGHQYTREALF